VLRHLTHDCHRLLNRAGQLMVDSDDDPEYGIAVDYRSEQARSAAGTDGAQTARESFSAGFAASRNCDEIPICAMSDGGIS
jgi:hypothetical protein